MIDIVTSMRNISLLQKFPKRNEAAIASADYATKERVSLLLIRPHNSRRNGTTRKW